MKFGEYFVKRRLAGLFEGSRACTSRSRNPEAIETVLPKRFQLLHVLINMF